MNNINQLFFELIQVAIGTRNCLSHTPSADEWGELYAMAKKQSLVGICFSAVQKLTNNQEPITQNLDEIQYLTWMGMAAKIQQRNGVMNRRCVEVKRILAERGYRAHVIKGQALAPYYGEFALLRQSGDIDVWVKASVENIVETMKSMGVGYYATKVHVECQMFPDTEVEIHPTPAIFRCPWMNRRLQRFFEKFEEPNTEFNLVFLLVHIYHHVLYEGVGLRQLLDYYFVLKSSIETKTIKTPEGTASACASENLSKLNSSATQTSTDSHAFDLEPSGKKQEKQPSLPFVLSVLDSFGMKRFAAGMMDIMHNVFGMPEEELLCEPDPEIGAFLLSEIMQGGNFGKYDTRDTYVRSDKPLERVLGGIIRNNRYFTLAPLEVLCSPLWRLNHFLWMKRRHYR